MGYAMSLVSESKITLTLAFPLVIGQISQMLLGVADTVMIGKLGVTPLATLTFANSLFYVPFIFGIGIITATSVFTSGANGAGDREAGKRSCKLGMYVATAVGLLLFLLMCGLSWNLGMFRQPPEVQEMTESYFRIVMASMVPALMSLALKNHSDAMDRPWPAFWIFMAGVLLNIFLNWVMIYGNWACPAMGINGGAYATLISRVAILIGMIVWLRKDAQLCEWMPDDWKIWPSFTEVKHFLKIGFPAALQMICEVSAFSAAGLMMGYFGATAMAAHQIALMCAATAFMIPLGLSMALSVRIGTVAGAGEKERMRPIIVSGWFIGASYALVGALAFTWFGHEMAAFYTKEAEVIRMAASMLIVVGIFQLFDSIQIASVAMLRGLQDTAKPAIIGFISYWLIGLPFAAFTSMKLGNGPVSVWWGLALGLWIACVALSPRLWKMTRA